MIPPSSPRSPRHPAEPAAHAGDAPARTAATASNVDSPGAASAGRPAGAGAGGGRRWALAALGVVVALAPAACAKKDDGATVRNLGTSAGGSGGTTVGTSGSASASGSGSGSASGPSVTDGSGSASGPSATDGTGSASGSASGSVEAATCEPVGDIASATTRLEVEAKDFSYVLSADRVAAGKVGITVRNTGSEPHELVVVRAEGVAALPMGTDGRVDEDRVAAADLIGEIEAFPAGESCSGVFDLSPGSYVLFCNILGAAGDKTTSHVRKGMASPLTVG